MTTASLKNLILGKLPCKENQNRFINFWVKNFYMLFFTCEMSSLQVPYEGVPKDKKHILNVIARFWQYIFHIQRAKCQNSKNEIKNTKNLKKVYRVNVSKMNWLDVVRHAELNKPGFKTVAQVVLSE